MCIVEDNGIRLILTTGTELVITEENYDKYFDYKIIEIEAFTCWYKLYEEGDIQFVAFISDEEGE